MKKCLICCKVLSFDSFYKKKNSKNGLNYRCKSCHNSFIHQKNKEYLREYQRKYWIENKERLQEYKKQYWIKNKEKDRLEKIRKQFSC